MARSPIRWLHDELPGLVRSGVLDDGAADRLRDEFGVADDELEAIKASVEEEAQDAYRFADESPVPDPVHLYDYTYAE